MGIACPAAPADTYLDLIRLAIRLIWEVVWPIGHLPLTGRGAGEVPEPAAGTFAAGSEPFAATR